MVAEKIYLATHDVQRAHLLAHLGLPFDTLQFRLGARADPEVSDEVVAGETPLEHAHRVASARAMGGVRRLAMRHLPPGVVLGCATVVDLEGEVLIRPAHVAAAVHMLHRLSGRSHRVISVVVIADRERSAEAVSASEVRLARLGDAEIGRCLSLGLAAEEPGAYSLLGPAGAWIEHVNGSCSGIMGLPLRETENLLQGFGAAR